MMTVKSLSLNHLRLSYGLQIVTLTLLIVMGYVVTPVLFSQLSSHLAGQVASSLFVITAVFSLVSFSLLAWQTCHHKQPLKYRWFWLVNLIILSVMLFGLTPWMQDIKALYPQGLTKESVDWPLFATLHGIYQLGYLLVSILTIFGLYRTIKKA